ncbi:cobalamin biosynthesis protein CobT [Robbsia sp. KACC 23696]|uniref:cobaltochelatase CobT-related protein n=1 Tax=Robbsia sp. KACC 23696 TaxID=3149231 RepID=UPI00325ABC80
MQEHDLGEHLSKLARTLTRRPDITVVFGDDGPAWDGAHLLLPSRLLGDGVSLATMIGYVDQLAASDLFGDAAAIDALRAPTLRALAHVLDAHRTTHSLLARQPGARQFVAAARHDKTQTMARRVPELSWPARLTWHIEQALWHEAGAALAANAGTDVASILHGIDDLLAAARAAASTSDSIRITQRIATRVRSLGADTANAMMFVMDGHAASESNKELGDELPDAEQTRPPEVGDAAAGAIADSAESAAQPPSSGDVADRPSGPPAQTVSDRSIPITTAFDTVTDLTGQGDPLAWRRLRNAARADTAPLRAKLERVLKSEEATHWQSEQERGELHRAALFRFAASPGYRTPFQTRRIHPTRDTAVTLLVDRSGSMAASKIALARLCVAALCDAMTRLGFACEVLGYCSVEDPEMRAYHRHWLAAGNAPDGYNRFVEKLDLQVYKRFDSNNLSGIAAIECGHENPDGEALSWAAARLSERRERRHVLMVFSDGYPSTADGNPAILGADLKRRVADLQLQGIELVGVGILNDAVETFYPVTAVVEKLEDLPASAFALLGKALLRRRGR